MTWNLFMSDFQTSGNFSCNFLSLFHSTFFYYVDVIWKYNSEWRWLIGKNYNLRYILNCNWRRPYSRKCFFSFIVCYALWIFRDQILLTVSVSLENLSFSSRTLQWSTKGEPIQFFLFTGLPYVKTLHIFFSTE